MELSDLFKLILSSFVEARLQIGDMCVIIKKEKPGEEKPPKEEKGGGSTK